MTLSPMLTSFPQNLNICGTTFTTQPPPQLPKFRPCNLYSLQTPSRRPLSPLQIPPPTCPPCPVPEFEVAVKQSRELTAKPTDDELLQLYAYYKQVMQNPSFDEAEVPGTFDFKGKAKHRAWKKVVDENVTPAEAEKKYIALVNEFKGKYGTN